MTAVVSWGGDSMPDGVSIGPAAESSLFFTKRKARELTDSIRADLAGAVIGMQLAREGHAHLALGYPTWHQYVIEEFGDIRELRLPVAERRALVASMCEAGASVTDIVKAIGFSRGTVQGDRVALGLSDAKPAGQVVPLHEPEANPYEGLSQPREALARVAAQDDRGLTCRELEQETGWLHQSASPALRKIEKRGWVERDGRTRGGFGTYVVTEVGMAMLTSLREKA
jgi:hypothetical protein